MEAHAEKRKYTYADYLNTPDDERYELLEGELAMTPSPVTKHQKILTNLGVALVNHVKGNSLGDVFFAPYDVVLDDENVVQPDILFISKVRLSIIGEKNVHGAPDMVVEILSEATAYRDSIQKKRLYARSGVRELWLVAPDDRLVEAYDLKGAGEYALRKTY